METEKSTFVFNIYCEKARKRTIKNHKEKSKPWFVGRLRFTNWPEIEFPQWVEGAVRASKIGPSVS